VLALIAVGAFLAWWGWAIVANIWGYADSPDWVYLTFGLPLIAAGICCFVGAALAVRRR
jgi:hypothetical protein